jgi:hypothetical protein
MRQAWGYVSTIGLFGLLLMAFASWVPQPPTVSTPPEMSWEPITVAMAMMLSDYSDRGDWSGCETRGVAPLFVRCPDGWTLEVR